MKTIPFFICFLFTLALPMAVSGEKTPVVSGEESPEVSDEKSPAVSGEESPKVHVVVIKEGIFGFLPDTLTIQVGERVKWVNEDSKEVHFIIDDFRSYSGVKPEIGSHILEPNQTFEYTYLRPGKFPYQCFFHFQKHQMKGVIIVEDKDL